MIVDNAHGKRGRYQAVYTTTYGRTVKGPLRYTIAEAQQDEGIIKTSPSIVASEDIPSKSIIPIILVGGLAILAYHLSK